MHWLWLTYWAVGAGVIWAVNHAVVQVSIARLPF
jgi:hypothetical protein